MSEEEIKKLFENIDERIILHNAIKEPISKDLDNLIKLSVAYEKLQLENQQLKEEIKYSIPVVEHNKWITNIVKQRDLYKSVIDEIEKIIKECKALFPHEYDWDEQTDSILTKIANIKESD